MRINRCLFIITITSSIVICLCVNILWLLKKNKADFDILIARLSACRTVRETERLITSPIISIPFPSLNDLSYYALEYNDNLTNQSVNIFAWNGVPHKYVFIFFDKRTSNVTAVCSAKM